MLTSELEGAALDAAVAKAEGVELVDGAAWDADLGVWRGWHPSADWRVGGPIIERERIGVQFDGASWAALVGQEFDSFRGVFGVAGPTPLIAAMRSYVASKFGEDVELP